jgi:hypothetical protein
MAGYKLMSDGELEAPPPSEPAGRTFRTCVPRTTLFAVLAWLSFFLSVLAFGTPAWSATIIDPNCGERYSCEWIYFGLWQFCLRNSGSSGAYYYDDGEVTTSCESFHASSPLFQLARFCAAIACLNSLIAAAATGALCCNCYGLYRQQKVPTQQLAGLAMLGTAAAAFFAVVFWVAFVAGSGSDETQAAMAPTPTPSPTTATDPSFPTLAPTTSYYYPTSYPTPTQDQPQQSAHPNRLKVSFSLSFEIVALILAFGAFLLSPFQIRLCGRTFTSPFRHRPGAHGVSAVGGPLMAMNAEGLSDPSDACGAGIHMVDQHQGPGKDLDADMDPTAYVQLQSDTTHKEKSYWCALCTRSPHGRIAFLNAGFLLLLLMLASGTWSRGGIGWGWESEWVLLIFGIFYFFDCTCSKTARFLYGMDHVEDVYSHVDTIKAKGPWFK